MRINLLTDEEAQAFELFRYTLWIQSGVIEKPTDSDVVRKAVVERMLEIKKDQPWLFEEAKKMWQRRPQS